MKVSIYSSQNEHNGYTVITLATCYPVTFAYIFVNHQVIISNERMKAINFREVACR